MLVVESLTTEQIYANLNINRHNNKCRYANFEVYKQKLNLWLSWNNMQITTTQFYGWRLYESFKIVKQKISFMNEQHHSFTNINFQKK